jgi:hypothetical protein
LKPHFVETRLETTGFGKPFKLLDSRVEQHTTPRAMRQQFAYCLCRRATAPA